MSRESFGSAKEKLYWAIQGAITAANREKEYIVLAGVEGEAPDPHTQLIRMLIDAAKEVRAARHHRHEWNDDDYCGVCGADGRA